MLYTIKQVFILSGVVLLVFLIMMLIFTSGLTPVVKATAILSCVAGLIAMFYFLNKRDPEAAARRRVALALVALAISILGTAGAISWLPASIEFPVKLFGFDLILKVDEVPKGMELLGLIVAAIVAMICATRLLSHTNIENPPAPFGADWQTRLEASLISKPDQSELDMHKYISDTFAINPSVLVKHYIEPDCQPQNPANYNEDNPYAAFRQPVHDFLNRFLHREFVERDGSHILFVLSDAGMGKSSLLIMLKLTHLSKKFWPEDTEVEILKLGNDTIESIESLSNKGKTVLLLDALDEDPVAFGRVYKRLEELLKSTTAFRQVIITVRTQFFPGGAPEPLEAAGRVDVANYRCSLVYLSPFSDPQVDAYLKKAYPNNHIQNLLEWLFGWNNTKREQARKIITPMKSLRMRPMLLAHIADLMEASVESWDEYSVYDELVRHWLQREARKKTAGVREQDLRLACEYLAVQLQEKGLRLLPESEFSRLFTEQPELAQLKEIDIGGRSLLNRTSEDKWRFSHYTVQEFLVVAAVAAEREFITTEKLLRGTDQILRFELARARNIAERAQTLRHFSFDDVNISSILPLLATKVPEMVSNKLEYDVLTGMQVEIGGNGSGANRYVYICQLKIESNVLAVYMSARETFIGDKPTLEFRIESDWPKQRLITWEAMPEPSTLQLVYYTVHSALVDAIDLLTDSMLSEPLTRIHASTRSRIRSGLLCHTTTKRVTISKRQPIRPKRVYLTIITPAGQAYRDDAILKYVGSYTAPVHIAELPNWAQADMLMEPIRGSAVNIEVQVDAEEFDLYMEKIRKLTSGHQ